MYNNRLDRTAMEISEYCMGIANEQYGSRKKHTTDIQALNTKLYYDLIRMERTPATSTFIYLVYN